LLYSSWTLPESSLEIRLLISDNEGTPSGVQEDYRLCILLLLSNPGGVEHIPPRTPRTAEASAKEQVRAIDPEINNHGVVEELNF